jgi:WD40 repeat protein
MSCANSFTLPTRHTRRVNILQFDKTGTLLASAGDDGFLNIWNFDLKDYVLSHRFVDGITDVAWLPALSEECSIAVAVRGGFVVQVGFSPTDPGQTPRLVNLEPSTEGTIQRLAYADCMLVGCGDTGVVFWKRWAPAWGQLFRRGTFHHLLMNI